MSSLNVCVVAFEGVSLFHLSVPAMVLGAGDEWPDSARMTVGFWPVVACRDRYQWLFSDSMPVKSNANEWSGRMQVDGQVFAFTQSVVAS